MAGFINLAYDISEKFHKVKKGLVFYRMSLVASLAPSSFPDLYCDVAINGLLRQVWALYSVIKTLVDEPYLFVGRDTNLSA